MAEQLQSQERAVTKLLDERLAEVTRRIGENLQSQLPELIYVTQAMHDQNVLSAPKDDKRSRMKEAKGSTFTDYNEKIAVPLWQKQAEASDADLEKFVQGGSMTRIIGRLSSNPKVHIMHNADDFMAERKSIVELKEALGDQVTLYPYGGHLGNLWFPANKELAIKFFRARP
jgi:hypothetical protein